jgi:hypothetical protein
MHNLSFNSSKVDYEKKLAIQFLSGIEKLLKKFSNEKFLLRPHPGENADFYRTYFQKYLNIEINEKIGISDILNEVKFTIHPGCTTAVEAAMQRVVSVCFCPLLDRRNIAMLPFMLSYKCTDEIKLVNLCEAILKEKLKYKEKKNVIKKYIDNYDYYSAEKISKEIIDYELYKKNSHFHAKIKWFLFDIVFYSKYFAIYFYKNIFHAKFRKIKKQQKIRAIYKIPYINQKEIKDLLEKYQSLLKKNYNYKISELSENFFKIENI